MVSHTYHREPSLASRFSVFVSYKRLFPTIRHRSTDQSVENLVTHFAVVADYYEPLGVPLHNNSCRTVEGRVVVFRHVLSLFVLRCLLRHGQTISATNFRVNTRNKQFLQEFSVPHRLLGRVLAPHANGSDSLNLLDQRENSPVINLNALVVSLRLPVRLMLQLVQNRLCQLHFVTSLIGLSFELRHITDPNPPQPNRNQT